MLDSPYLTLIGRVLLGFMFLVSGIHKIADTHGTQQHMIMMGMTWMTTLFYIGAVVVEVAGSLCPCCLDTVHGRSAGCCFCS